MQVINKVSNGKTPSDIQPLHSTPFHIPAFTKMEPLHIHNTAFGPTGKIMVTVLNWEGGGGGGVGYSVNVC